jgi:hypothetical protein
VRAKLEQVIGVIEHKFGFRKSGTAVKRRTSTASI